MNKFKTESMLFNKTNPEKKLPLSLKSEKKNSIALNTKKGSFFLDPKENIKRNSDFVSYSKLPRNLIKERSSLQHLLFGYKKNFENDFKDLEENLPFRKSSKFTYYNVSIKTFISNLDLCEDTNKRSAILNEINHDPDANQDKKIYVESYNKSTSLSNYQIRKIKNSKNFNNSNPIFIKETSNKYGTSKSSLFGYNEFPKKLQPGLDDETILPSNLDRISENILIKPDDNFGLICSPHKIETIIDNLQSKNKVDSQDLKEEYSRDLNKFRNVYDSLSICEEVNEFNYSKILINPSGPFKQSWEKLMVVMIIYSMIITPYLICFLEKRSITEVSLEFFVDIMFIIDFGLNFITPFYDKEENLILNLPKIIENYLENSLIFDLITCIPFSIIAHTIILSHQTLIDLDTSVKFILCLQWIRLLRVFKLERRTSTLYSVEIDNFEDARIYRLIKFLIYFCLIIHVTSCIWVFIARINFDKINWIKANNLNDSDKFEIYVASFYFNMVTIYTIGYGDITAVNKLERLYLCIFMFVGVLLYSYTVSNFSTIITITDKNTIEYERKLQILEMINYDHEMSNLLFKKIKKYLKVCYKNSYDERYNLLESLPNKIKNDLTLFMYKNHIKELNFFKGQPHDMILHVLPLLKTHNVKKRDTLCSVGEFMEEMYLVIRGSLVLTLSDQLDNIEIYQIRANQHFGEIFFETNEQSPFELKCKSKNTVLLVLKKNDYLSVKNVFRENIIEILKNSYQTLERIYKKKTVILELLKIDENPQSIKNFLKIINKEMINNHIDNFNMREEILTDEVEYLVKNQEKFVQILKSNIENQQNKQNSLKTKGENEFYKQLQRKTKLNEEGKEINTCKNGNLFCSSENDKEKTDRTKRKLTDRRNSDSSIDKSVLISSQKEKNFMLNEDSNDFINNIESLKSITTKKKSSTKKLNKSNKDKSNTSNKYNIDNINTFSDLIQEEAKSESPVIKLINTVNNKIVNNAEEKEEFSPKSNNKKERKHFRSIKTLNKAKRRNPVFGRNASLITEILKNIDVDKKHLNLLLEQIDIQTKAKSLLKKKTIKERLKTKRKNKTQNIIKHNQNSLLSNSSSSCEEKSRKESEINNFIIINNNFINKEQNRDTHEENTVKLQSLNNERYEKKYYLKICDVTSFSLVQSISKTECFSCKIRLDSYLQIEKPIEIYIASSVFDEQSDENELNKENKMKFFKYNTNKLIVKVNVGTKNIINFEREKLQSYSKLINNEFTNENSNLNNQNENDYERSFIKNNSSTNNLFENDPEKSISRFVKKGINNNIDLNYNISNNKDNINLIKDDQILKKEINDINNNLKDYKNFKKIMKKVIKSLDNFLVKIEIYKFVNR